MLSHSFVRYFFLCSYSVVSSRAHIYTLTSSFVSSSRLSFFLSFGGRHLMHSNSMVMTEQIVVLILLLLQNRHSLWLRFVCDAHHSRRSNVFVVIIFVVSVILLLLLLPLISLPLLGTKFCSFFFSNFFYFFCLFFFHFFFLSCSSLFSISDCHLLLFVHV